MDTLVLMVVLLLGDNRPHGGAQVSLAPVAAASWRACLRDKPAVLGRALAWAKHAEVAEAALGENVLRAEVWCEEVERATGRVVRRR